MPFENYQGMVKTGKVLFLTFFFFSSSPRDFGKLRLIANQWQVRLAGLGGGREIRTGLFSDRAYFQTRTFSDQTIFRPAYFQTRTFSDHYVLGPIFRPGYFQTGTFSDQDIFRPGLFQTKTIFRPGHFQTETFSDRDIFRP